MAADIMQMVMPSRNILIYYKNTTLKMQLISLRIHNMYYLHNWSAEILH